MQFVDIDDEVKQFAKTIKKFRFVLIHFYWRVFLIIYREKRLRLMYSII